jgi:ectoine hydroxylase-related dioxygenase (phytanoyl-CoA dioxygenase family)
MEGEALLASQVGGRLTEMKSVPRFDCAADPTDVALALEAAGAVIVERLVDPEVMAAIDAETRPFREATASGRDDFSGHNTRRTGALLARSPSSQQVIAHPTVLGVCDEILGAHATGYQLHLTQLIDIGGGEPAQMLHRDHWAWDFFPFPSGFHVEVSTMWALTDFTVENGATRVVPGSHHWPHDMRLGDPLLDGAESEQQWVQADMPVGSVLMYLGSTVHGAGENRTGERRVGVNVDYCLSWLRQEENQYLACPPDVAATLPIDVAKLAGYAKGAYALGYFADTLDPMEAVHPGAVEHRGLG